MGLLAVIRVICVWIFASCFTVAYMLANGYTAWLWTEPKVLCCLNPSHGSLFTVANRPLQEQQTQPSSHPEPALQHTRVNEEITCI